MVLKIFVLCFAITTAYAGVLRTDLKYESPIIVSPPAIKYEIPPTSRVEHIAPVHTTSYGYSTLPLKHEVVATPVARVAAPVAIAAPTIHVETPAVSRIEHLAPAVASSYKTEVITPPKVHVSHTPAVARIEHVAPVVAAPAFRVEAPVHVAVAQPALRVEQPLFTRVEHLAPAVASSYKTELISAPSVKVETAPAHVLRVETPTIAKFEHLAPALHAEYVSPTISYAAAPIAARTELLAPAVSAYKSHVIAEPALRLAHSAPLALEHSLGLKHLSYTF